MHPRLVAFVLEPAQHKQVVQEREVLVAAGAVATAPVTPAAPHWPGAARVGRARVGARPAGPAR